MTPSRLGNYEIVRRIGAGGMAEVLLGRRAGPGGFAKPVAVKRLLPEIAREEELRAMFVEEARLQAGLSHRNLVQVFDFGEDGGERFLVMEYVEGTDLSALLGREGRLAPALALHVAAEIAEGLDYLHARGIVHRDVSPGNVYLSRAGEVKLGDFGIAKGRAPALRTERGRLKGKLAYLAPEQARGDVVDARADLYALGLLLFEMLSGGRYLAGDAEVDVLRAAMDPAPRSAGTGGAADTVAAWLLQPHREERPASARFAAGAIHKAIAELGETPGSAALAALVEGVAPPRDQGAPTAGRPGTERLAQRTRVRGRLVVAVAGAVATVLVAWLMTRDGNRAFVRQPDRVAPDPVPAPVSPPARLPDTPPPAASAIPATPPRARPTHRPSSGVTASRTSPLNTASAPPAAAPGPAAPPAPTQAPPERGAPDRASIERRLAALGARLDRAPLDAGQRDQARRLAQQALDSAIEQRFAEADRKLDALEALLSRATGRPR